MRQTIRWNNALNQFVELEAIKNLTPFTSKTINNVTYNKVTQAISIGQTFYPWTTWTMANYYQQFGFIELIDINGNSWLRQYLHARKGFVQLWLEGSTITGNVYRPEKYYLNSTLKKNFSIYSLIFQKLSST